MGNLETHAQNRMGYRFPVENMTLHFSQATDCTPHRLVKHALDHERSRFFRSMIVTRIKQHRICSKLKRGIAWLSGFE